MEHGHEGKSFLDTIIEITFSVDHMVAEFFWNAVFALAVYGFAKARTLRKIHKYVDSKHGVEHEEY
jgi:ABC-type sulfate transport system permease subunit